MVNDVWNYWSFVCKTILEGKDNILCCMDTFLFGLGSSQAQEIDGVEPAADRVEVRSVSDCYACCIAAF